MSKAKAFFQDHAASNVVFETSDGLLFHQDGDAMLHAKTLANKNITTHLREVVLSEAETDTMPVIDKLVTHSVSSEADSNETITAASLQPAVTPQVQEKLKTAEKATGEAVTDTEMVKGENLKPETVKVVATPTGEVAANKAAAPAQKGGKKAGK